MWKRLIDRILGRPSLDVKLPWDGEKPIPLRDDVPLDQTTALTHIEGDTSSF